MSETVLTQEQRIKRVSELQELIELQEKEITSKTSLLKVMKTNVADMELEKSELCLHLHVEDDLKSSITVRKIIRSELDVDKQKESAQLELLKNLQKCIVCDVEHPVGVQDANYIEDEKCIQIKHYTKHEKAKIVAEAIVPGEWVCGKCVKRII